MNEKLLDVPLRNEKTGWEDLANVPFPGDDDPLLPPIDFSSRPASRRPSPRSSLEKSPRESLSPAERRAREDKLIGTGAAIAAGALVGTGFVGAGLSAPIAGAVIAGTKAYNTLKNREEKIKKEQFETAHNTDYTRWREILEHDLGKIGK